jgi:LysM repeat protein
MSPDIPTSSTKLCPTCGTRLSENATRCLVCGKALTPNAVARTNKDLQAPHMPEMTLSLPIALGLMTIFLAIGAGVVFAVLSGTGRVVEPTTTATITITPTITLTASPSPTYTPLPSFTPLPPIEYSIKENEYCSTLAAIFNVSIQSIVLLNNLPADCGTLYIGQKILVPQPTPTASPQPTSTLNEAEATDDACEKFSYTVTENDTLSSISANYNISIEALKEYNGFTTDIVYQGQSMIIPLCRRNPTPGPTPTATLPPPYPAANLLLPADGSVFLVGNDTITIQWAAVGTIRENEAYQVTIEDVTAASGRKLVQTVTDTKFIVPATFRPLEDKPHIIRWWIQPVRQAGTTSDGQPVWKSAGAISVQRVFSWWGINIATPTP